MQEEGVNDEDVTELREELLKVQFQRWGSNKAATINKNLTNHKTSGFIKFTCESWVSVKTLNY